MPKCVVDVGQIADIPWLDIASHGRRGSRQVIRFTRAQLEQIALTVRRAPEVMVKVSGGGRSPGAVAAHLRYIGRHGKLNIETDDGELLAGRHAAQTILSNWFLGHDLSGHDAEGYRARAAGPSKQVHNIVLSMPAKTVPGKLLTAAKAFAREEFALKNRYAMVLHTDQDHPHVHLVVAAVGLDGRRLHITKVTLRSWREQFANQLRGIGIPANATPSRIRRQPGGRMPDGLYRLLQRQPAKSSTSPSRQMKASTAGPYRTLPIKARAGSGQLKQVSTAWEVVRANLEKAGERELAKDVRTFAAALNSARPKEAANRRLAGTLGIEIR